MRYLIIFLCLAISCLTAAAQQTEIVPLAHSFYLIGGVTKDGKWLTMQETAPFFKNKTEFSLVGLKGVENKIFGNIGEEFGACPDVLSMNFETENTTSMAVGTNAVWNIVPRIPQKISLTDKTYVKSIANFLKTKGVSKTNVKITQLFRVDLDGDGQNETVISGNYYKKGMIEEQNAGDYSFVLVQNTVDKKAKNTLIDGEFFTKKGEYAPPNEREISAVADLNGDGKMEIVLHTSYYEGDSVSIYQQKEKEWKIALEVGCGL